MTDNALQLADERFMADLIHACNDIVTLGEDHGMDAQALADWMAKPEHARCLTQLISLADLQTQWLLSRHRGLAVQRLLTMAADKNEKGETVRRACVDLMKLNVTTMLGDADEDALDASIPTAAGLYGEVEKGDSNEALKPDDPSLVDGDSEEDA